MSAHDTQLAPVSMNPNRVMTSFSKLSSLHNSLILSGNSNQQVRFLLAQTLAVRTCVILIMDVNRVFSVLWIFAHNDKISMASSGAAHPINKEIKIPNAFCSCSWSLFTSHPCSNVTSAPRWQSASMCGANPPIVPQPVMEALSFEHTGMKASECTGKLHVGCRDGFWFWFWIIKRVMIPELLTRFRWGKWRTVSCCIRLLRWFTKGVPEGQFKLCQQIGKPELTKNSLRLNAWVFGSSTCFPYLATPLGCQAFVFIGYGSCQQPWCGPSKTSSAPSNSQASSDG